MKPGIGSAMKRSPSHGSVQACKKLERRRSVSIYENGKYLTENETWHIEDSPWKATQVLRLLNGHHIDARTVCEVGCGAGEILVQLSKTLLEECTFVGYDISPHLENMWRKRESDRIRFVCQDFLTSEESYDLLMFLDVIEHVEDYIGFLRKIRDRSRYKVFAFPLEIFALKALLGRRYLDSRTRYGHIHYFNKDICLSVLKELGFEIIDYFYAPGTVDLSSISKSISPMSRLAKLPRMVVSQMSTDLSAKLLGGYSLFVLAE